MQQAELLDVAPLVIHPVSTHHEALGVTPESTAEEVARAYRRQSLRWHPDKNINNKVVAERRFQEITDAYAALVDADTGKLKELEKVERRYTGPAMEGMHKSTVTEELLLTLDELYRGCRKVKELRRGRMRRGDRVEERIKLAIPVAPGTRPGTKLYYPDQGDQVFGGQIADLVYEVKVAPHPVYRWVGDDLIHRHFLTPDRHDIRLERFTECLVGKPTVPLAPYCNIMSELCGVHVTLVPPMDIPKDIAGSVRGRQNHVEQNTPAECTWRAPQGRGMKMRDRDATATRLRIPGALQAAVGKTTFAEADGFHSVAWKINKKTDEVVVGVAHPSALLDRKYYAGDVCRANWGLVWGSDGGLYRLGTDKPKADLPKYGPGDVLQLSFHAADGLLLAFKNKELVFREGEKFVVSTKDAKDGDVASVEEMGMPVLNDGKVVGRGDLLVRFINPAKPTVAAVQAAASEADESGAADRLDEWLAARKHPPPVWDTNEWGEGGGRKYQAKVTLNQKRPFAADGKFDGVTMMGRMHEGQAPARDSAAAKVLRMLGKLSERFPQVHQLKKRPREADAGDACSTAASMATAVSSEIPAKRPRMADAVDAAPAAPAPPPVPLEPTADVDDID